MSWIYTQRSGELHHGTTLIGKGYSGAPGAVNDPSRQSEHNVGCIPVGWYDIGDPVDTVTHGPHVLPLTPHADTQMFGRSGFLIHGDSVVRPGTASQGCVILSRDIRNQISASDDRLLQVISG